MTTTAGPKNTVKFYLALPCSLLEPRENNSISFRIPANKLFPRTLRPIIRKTKRVFSFEKSNIVGTSGTTTTIVCQGTGCMGYMDKTNSTTYTMTPLYPPRNTFVEKEKPKIGFVGYFSQLGTPPPPFITRQPNNDFAIFSINYNNFRQFKTSESYTELFDSVMRTQNNLLMINEPLYAQHNLGALDMIQKLNKIPKTSSQTLRPQKQQQPEKKKVVERYEEDVEMEDVNVPNTEDDSTEEETGAILLTLAPEEDILSYKTSGSTPTKIPWGLIGGIVVAVFIVLLVLFIGGVGHKVKAQAQAQAKRKRRLQQ